jgi:arginyl-tRNA synthetase
MARTIARMVPPGLADAIADACADLGLQRPATVVLERPRIAEHGDWSTNVALASAKAAGRSPRDIAVALAERLNANPPPHVSKVEVAGPGFVNIRLHNSWLHEVLRIAVTEGETSFGRLDLGGGQTINVEFVSANPTGPLHAGHGRWAAYGDSLARVLERCGYRPHREFYVNDRGVQVERYAASLVARKRGEEPPADGYMGAYIAEWATEMPDDADPIEWGLERAHVYQRDTLASMGVVFDTWFSERALVADGVVEATLADLRATGHVYDADGAVWLRTTDFGEDKDRVLVKSDGEPTYFLPDIAYHRDKFNRGEHLINVLGADHHGYAPRMKVAVLALGHDADDLEIIIGQNVVLIRAGEEVRLSKRTGDFVELRDVIDEVGADATRFTYLLNSIDTKLTFDLDVVTQNTMENPVFYVQYAHARIRSIMRTAAERRVVRGPLADTDLSLLVHERELELLRVLGELPDVVNEACTKRAPNKVTTWVRELAGAFHGFFHDCYVMGDGVSPELTQARLWLIEGVRVGLVVALSLLGVSAPESM